jgi:hypothetical protein
MAFPLLRGIPGLRLLVVRWSSFFLTTDAVHFPAAIGPTTISAANF